MFEAYAVCSWCRLKEMVQRMSEWLNATSSEIHMHVIRSPMVIIIDVADVINSPLCFCFHFIRRKSLIRLSCFHFLTTHHNQIMLLIVLLPLPGGNEGCIDCIVSKKFIELFLTKAPEHSLDTESSMAAKINAPAKSILSSHSDCTLKIPRRIFMSCQC